MPNILIIKHGSLGDLIQANGAIEDIKNSFKESKVLLLTANNYSNFMSHCPYIDGVIVDKRLPRWNIFYLLKLKKILKRFNFTHVFDLQNSSRTKFYHKYLLKNSKWSSTYTTLSKGEKKSDFDKDPVLKRMKIQLEKSGVKISKINNINLSWAFTNINKILNQHTSGEYILIFPFCSEKHLKKKWPHYKELATKLKYIYKNKYTILIAPGPGEIKKSFNFNAKVILDNSNPLNLNQLITLIKDAKFIIANDTGPAHISSHMKKNGLVLFGKHTTAEKVSLGNDNFKPISVDNLKNLSVDNVIKEIKKNLN